MLTTLGVADVTDKHRYSNLKSLKKFSNSTVQTETEYTNDLDVFNFLYDFNR